MSDAPIFDDRYAQCQGCELREQCARGSLVPGVPSSAGTGGIMLLGEHPRPVDVARRAPFAGPAGGLLDALLGAAEIAREDVHLSHALLCLPPRAAKGDARKSLLARFPQSFGACMPRLESELAARRPKIVVAMGDAAMQMATGYWLTRNVHVDNVCGRCLPADRKVGPAIACARGCGWYALFEAGPDGSKEEPAIEHWRERLLESTNGECPTCGASIKRLKVRRIKCPSCGGRKKNVETRRYFKSDYGLVGKNGIAGALFPAAELDGRWDRYGVEWVICTLDPHYCMRSGSTDSKALSGQWAARVVVDHLEKAKALLGAPPRWGLHVTFTDRAEDVEAFTREPGSYTIDIETNAKSAWDVSDIRCIGIGRRGTDEVLVVDTRLMTRTKVHQAPGRPTRFETAISDERLYAALRSFLEREDAPLIAQNGEYDYIVIRRLWGYWPGPVAGDTKIAHQVLYPDEPHNLGHLGSCLTHVPFWKPPKTKGGVESFETFTDLGVYNAKDVRVTDVAHEVMAGQLAPERTTFPTGAQAIRWYRGGRLGLERLHDAYAVDMATYPIAMRMEYSGIPVDTSMLQQIAEEQEPIAADLLQQMIDFVGPVPKQHRPKNAIEDARFNPASSTSLLWALYDPTGPCRLTSPDRTDTGAPSTAKETLAKLSDNELVRLLLRWRDVSKTLSTYVYGKGLVLREDGRIHPSWNIGGARTGRWSSSPNFQNWPAWLRAAVKAPPGFAIIGADYSQLELRIMAALSGDAELIRRCRDADEERKLEPDWDPHSYVASHFFGDAFVGLRLDDKDQAKQRKALREIIKSCIYGLNYGAGPAKILEAIYKKGYDGPPITIQIVKQAVDIIFRLFPGIPSWRDGALETALQNEEVRSPLLHRWRTFPLGDVEATIAWNFPIQSCAADIINLRLLVLQMRLAAECPEAEIMAQVHDALYVLAPEKDAERVARIVTESMTVDLELVPGAPVMPFNATAKVGHSWDQVS